jgi:asparagine synthase (glutamine-hydrolysing)
MSVIFGIRDAAGQSIGESDLREISGLTGHFATDGTFLRAEGNMGMGYQPFYTHERSRLEIQPLTDAHGNALLWDGRLDNSLELAGTLGLPSQETPDSKIVLAAFRCWGQSCFSKFIGEWALVLCSHFDRSVFLVRDHAGTRTLYYRLQGEKLMWSSALETLTGPTERCALSEEFVARYLCSLPVGTLTPYDAIRAVPPGHFVRVSGRSAVLHRYWDAQAAAILAYKTDTEYEEHFYGLFQQAVERRTGRGVPVLAELSGGMDSSAIVCISDELRAKSGQAPSELIDTISYFDNGEPNWDERPFVSLMESRRRKSGIHVDLTPAGPAAEYDLSKNTSPSIWPEDSPVTSTQPEAEHGFRAVVSGLGGDELLGGVPTPLPELGDLLHGHRYIELLTRSFAWCLSDRTALIGRLWDVVRFRASVYRREIVSRSAIPPWVTERCQKAVGLSPEEDLEYLRCREMPPSAVSFLRAWSLLIETLPRHKSRDRQRTERRFPFLDRDLVAFLARVPREQLVRPGRRRSLMRRALKQTIPAEILERRRKAFVIRPVLALRENNLAIRAMFERPVSAERGYIDRSRLLAAFQEFQTGTNISSHWSLSRAINLERWLRNLAPIE